jgi:hypothetical protein
MRSVRWHRIAVIKIHPRRKWTENWHEMAAGEEGLLGH